MSSNIVIGAEVAPFQTYDFVYDLSFVTYVPSFVLNKRCVWDVTIFTVVNHNSVSSIPYKNLSEWKYLAERQK